VIVVRHLAGANEADRDAMLGVTLASAPKTGEGTMPEIKTPPVAVAVVARKRVGWWSVWYS
jgi:hypothetical protein